MLDYIYDQAKQLIDSVRQETRERGPLAAPAAARRRRIVDLADLPLGHRDRRLRGAFHGPRRPIPPFERSVRRLARADGPDALSDRPYGASADRRGARWSSRRDAARS